MELNNKEKLKYNVIKDIVENSYDKEEASLKLGISIRQINRLIKIYKIAGEDGFIHKNRGKESMWKVDEKIKEEISDLYINEFYDFNFTHFYEKIEEKYNISQASVYRILMEKDYISPVAHKTTKKAYYKSLEESIAKGKKEEINKVQESRLMQQEEAHIRRSKNQFRYGEEVQMDACFKIWFGGIITALHLAVDKSTTTVLSGYFEENETTHAYNVLLMETVKTKGIPLKIKTDKRGTFSINLKQIKSNLNETQFGCSCKKLGIRLVTSSNPLFKPNVERLNRTFKDRLVAELRYNKIETIQEANKYLNEVFIPHYNKRFAYKISENRNVMRENKYSEEELNIIIATRYVRHIDNACSIKYFSKYYLPIDEYGEVKTYKAGTECIIIKAYNETLWCEIENEIYNLLEIEMPVKEKKENIKRERKRWIPPADHPWRNFKK